jgi:hypothetical protein
MISKPALASRKTANASGPSKPLKSGAARLKSEGLSKTAAMTDYQPDELRYFDENHAFAVPARL